MTLAQLRARTYRALGVTSTTPIFWTDAEINRLLNDAYIEVVKRTGALEIRHTVSTESGTSTYTLPSTVGRTMRVTYDDHKILPFTSFEFDRSVSNWENSTGVPTHYTIDGNDRTVRLWKTPDTASTAKVWAKKVPRAWSIVDGELGTVVDIDRPDGSDTYAFSSELGVVIDIDGGTDTYSFSAELGAVTDIEAPDETLQKDSDVPLLPAYSHLGLVFAAASRALRKRGASRNIPLAKTYAGMAKDYTRHLKARANNRTIERTYEHAGGATQSTFVRRRDVRIPIAS